MACERCSCLHKCLTKTEFSWTIKFKRSFVRQMTTFDTETFLVRLTFKGSIEIWRTRQSIPRWVRFQSAQLKWPTFAHCHAFKSLNASSFWNSEFASLTDMIWHSGSHDCCPHRGSWMLHITWYTRWVLCLVLDGSRASTANSFFSDTWHPRVSWVPSILVNTLTSRLKIMREHLRFCSTIDYPSSMSSAVSTLSYIMKL